ncbi:MAG TPA: BTAD domain-containing putative transcriptional regulator, partial [Acidimicrobiia bacterium]|nr:BTAD domain-containing putative transcriptional regulator [Acidimicrobiia bacterium]
MPKAANPDVYSGDAKHAGRHIVRKAVDVRLLGPLQIFDGSGRPLELSGDRPRGLLAVLALELPNFVSSDRLVDYLWGSEAAASPEAALHVAMSRLRKALGEDVIKTQAGGYRLEIPVANSDVERFRRHARRGRQLLTLGRPGPAAEAFRQALAQWRGIPLADLRRFEFAEQAARVLEEERLVSVEQLMEAELTAGNHDLVVGELSGLVEAFPLREQLWEQLMVALYRGGRQSEALRAYSRLRQILGDELGVEPSPELAELEERILLHDPGLETFAEPDGGDWLDEPEMINFSPGDVIVEEGGLADLVYWIEDGQVEVVRTGESPGEVVLAELGPGRYFGELASLLGTSRTATVRAVSPTTVSVHTVEGFRRRLGVERTKEPAGPTPIEEVRELIRRAEYLRAYDLASKLIETMRSDPELRFLAVLALARSGATAQAIRRYELLGLQSINPDSVSARLAEDISALAARLDKDMSLIDQERRTQWAARSAQGYQAAFDRHRSAYLAVNAATMWLMAGDH